MSISEKVSEAEVEVLRILWSKNTALTSMQINEELKQNKGWEKSTVRTLIYRLVEKGALRQEQREVFYYCPNITEKDYLADQTKKFLEKLYGGNAKNLVASLVEQEYIKQGDIDELKQFWKEGENKYVE